MGSMSALRLGGSRKDAWAALLVCSSIIILSALLTPNPSGYGTHERLVPVPCGFRALTRVPCPFCGMTTGFADMAHGRLRAAANANLMAPLGFVVTCALALLGLYGVVSGRGWLPVACHHPAFPRWLLALILAFWLINLALHFGGWHV